MRGWGKRLAQTREGHGRDNKTTFPYLVGSNRSSWPKFEAETTPPDFEILIQLQEVTGVSLDWLASGKLQQVAALDRSALSTAVTAALRIAESARAQGKSHTPEDMVTFIVDIYESVIKDSLDGNIPRTDSEQISPSKEAPTDARDRKANS